MRISLIVAAAANDVIGAGGDLPWRLPADLARFRRLTTGHVLIAGRRTQDSIVARLGQALPRRITVVLTRARPPADRELGTGLDGVIYRHDLDSALRTAQELEQAAGGDEIFVIGGAQLYTQALPLVTRIYLTRLHTDVPGDTCLPPGWLDGFELVHEEPGPAGDGPTITFQTYDRRVG
jgi:dihydrofolate reductase